MTDTKQPEALRLAEWLDLNGEFSAHFDAADELRLLHALCEEQKRLLEQAMDALGDARLTPTGCVPHGFHHRAFVLEEAITNHLRPQEGEKHE